MNRKLLRDVINESKKIHSLSRGSHDLEHTRRVYRLSEHIAKREKADVFIVNLAAALHDIARGIEDKSGGRIDHAAKGALMARQILKKHNAGEDIIEAVCHCIAAHRFRGSLRPETLEARCLFDADKLDSIGAVGIGRAFLFAGETGAKLHNSDIDVLKTKAYTADDTAYREYMVKLRHVKGRIFTREGKRIAKERHKFMKVFFKRLDLETSGRL
ncbi:MAG: HD domain-containing protein [Spirochaetia bacterium]|nr:HD domain-containing protein [Spirochaetia bacterium]